MLDDGNPRANERPTMQMIGIKQDWHLTVLTEGLLKSDKSVMDKSLRLFMKITISSHLHRVES